MIYLLFLLLAACAPAPDSGLLHVCVYPCLYEGGIIALNVHANGEINCHCGTGVVKPANGNESPGSRYRGDPQ